MSSRTFFSETLVNPTRKRAYQFIVVIKDDKLLVDSNCIMKSIDTIITEEMYTEKKLRQLELCISFKTEYEPKFSPIPRNAIIPNDMIDYYNNFYRDLRLKELNKTWPEFKLNDLWNIVNDFLDVSKIRDNGLGVLQDD